VRACLSFCGGVESKVGVGGELQGLTWPWYKIWIRVDLYFSRSLHISLSASPNIAIQR
jgi:hypothetical protein